MVTIMFGFTSHTVSQEGGSNDSIYGIRMIMLKFVFQLPVRS
jgi:hypothetical protein